MAKGDSVTVWVRGVSQPLVIEATKAGRRLEVTRGPKYMVIDEMTRTGRKTGRLLQIADTDLAAVIESKSELAAAPKGKRPVPGQIGLVDTIEAGEPTVAAEAPMPPEPKKPKRHDPAAEPDAKPVTTASIAASAQVVGIDYADGGDYSPPQKPKAAVEDDEDAMRQAAEDIFADLRP